MADFCQSKIKTTTTKRIKNDNQTQYSKTYFILNKNQKNTSQTMFLL